MRALGHLGAVERLGREPRQDGVGGFVEHGESVGIVRELMRVDEAAAGLVEGVGREAVAAIEAGDCGWSKAADEAMNLLLRRRVASYGISAREAGEILPEGVTGDVAGHVFGRIEVGRRGVPAAHVLARRGLAGELAEWFEETVVVEVQIEIVLVMELLEERAFKQLDLCRIRTGEEAVAGVLVFREGGSRGAADAAAMVAALRVRNWRAGLSVLHSGSPAHER